MYARFTPEATTAGDPRELAGLINHLRLPSFPKVMTEFLATQCRFDTALVATYKKAFKPIMLYPTEPQDISPTLRSYINSAYILDPLFNRIQQGNASGVIRLSEIAPDLFEASDYYQSCYQDFDLVDEINLVIELDDQVCCTVSLGRRSELGTITRAELARLNKLFPVIEALVRQFWLLQSQEYVQYEQSDTGMKQALNSFGQGVLTRREQEISALILEGHSSKAIAERLSISLGTVKVHRKNIHAKLDTSNQSEIFTLFLAHLNSRG